jgi:hypothetical protein
MRGDVGGSVGGGGVGGIDQLFRVAVLLRNDYRIAHITVKARRCRMRAIPI